MVSALYFAGREGVGRSTLAVTHYELGEIQARRGDHRAAAASYREAARRLLELFGPVDRQG